MAGAKTLHLVSNKKKEGRAVGQPWTVGNRGRGITMLGGDGNSKPSKHLSSYIVKKIERRLVKQQGANG